MKKLVMLMLVFVMLLGTLNVSAAIPINNGRGEVLQFDTLIKNSPGGGNAVISDVPDPDFGTVYQYAYDGKLTQTNVQFSLQFLNNSDAPSGAYYYMSFYYRYLLDDGNSEPNSFRRRPNVNNTSGQATITAEEGAWNKVSFITTSTGEILATSNIRMCLILFIDAGTKICMQIADPQCVYYGAVTAEDGKAPEQLIGEETAKSDISEVYIDGAAVNVAEYPDGYYTETVYDGTELPVITADTHVEGLYDLRSSSQTLPAKYTLTSYALNYNKITGTGNKSEYNINIDYKKAGADLDVGGAPIDNTYRAAAGDVININYQLYNFSEDTRSCILALAFCDGNMYKDIVTYKLDYISGVTEDTISHTVTEAETGTSVRAYVIDGAGMTVIN